MSSSTGVWSRALTSSSSSTETCPPTGAERVNPTGIADHGKQRRTMYRLLSSPLVYLELVPSHSFRHREHQSRSRDGTTLKSALRVGASGVPHVHHTHAVRSVPTRAACSVKETQCWTSRLFTERWASGSLDRLRETSDLKPGRGTSPSCGSAL